MRKDVEGNGSGIILGKIPACTWKTEENYEKSNSG
jgi:hypothetical protein